MILTCLASYDVVCLAVSILYKNVFDTMIGMKQNCIRQLPITNVLVADKCKIAMFDPDV